MPIKIRSETPADVTVITTVTNAAFLNAPHSNQREATIVSALRESGALTVSLVAEMDGRVVGHVAISPVSISDGATGWYGLGPIAVAPSFQCMGVGSALMHAAINALRDLGANGCVVLGEPRYYGRFGFRACPDLVLPNVPVEYFQAAMFDASTPKGIVQYDKAFCV